MSKLVIFDCDSTLSSLEGVDELARLRGDEIFRASEAMTNDAMEGRISIESVFGRRLDLIHPTQDEFTQLGQRYIDTVEPTAQETIRFLHQQGWRTAILSAGFLPSILPLAKWLGIDEVRAVPVAFHPDGSYKSFDATFPPTRSGGKPLVVRELKDTLKLTRVIMVGDGVSDAETAPEVDLFVGFGGFITRPAVKAKAGAWITSLAELIPLLEKP